MARPLKPEEFAAECDRRLMDTFEVMIHLGLRSRQAVWSRVEAGTLSRPILTKANNLSLWDRDSFPTDKEA